MGSDKNVGVASQVDTEGLPATGCRPSLWYPTSRLTSRARKEAGLVAKRLEEHWNPLPHGRGSLGGASGNPGFDEARGAQPQTWTTPPAAHGCGREIFGILSILDAVLSYPMGIHQKGVGFALLAITVVPWLVVAIQHR